MPVCLPPLNTLIAFEAAARLKSFAKAARELCITASAVSHRIRMLEQHYGVKFFLRNQQTVTLTNDGAALLDAVLEALLILRSASARLLKDSSRTIRINVSTAFANKWLAHRLNSYYEKHEEANIEIRAVHHTALNELADLRSGEVDIAIRYCRRNDWRQLKKTKLLSVNVFPVCSPEYKSKHKLKTPHDLGNAVLLRSPREPWSDWFRIAGIKNQPLASGTEFSDAGLLLSAAIGGQGVALARDVLSEEDIAHGRLVRVFEKSMPSDRSYYALYPASKTPQPGVETFVSWLVDESRKRRH